jgi:hypothetical protein
VNLAEEIDHFTADVPNATHTYWRTHVMPVIRNYFIAHIRYDDCIDFLRHITRRKVLISPMILTA